jgi:hypothetical protein
MRPSATAFVVAGLAGVALAAGIDAVRGGPRESAPPPTVAETEPAVASVLDRAGVRGVITYSDEACRLHAVALPSLRPARAPAAASCKPLVPTGGLTAWKGDVVWSGLGYGTVQVVLSRHELTREMRRAMRQRSYLGTERYRARQAVGLGDTRVAALVEESTSGWALVGIFERKRLLFFAGTDFLAGNDVLRPSPGGSFLSVLEPAEPGITVFTRDGEPFSLPEVTNPHAIAWSPDERWTALATRWSIYVFRSDGSGATIRLPVAGARDLAWGFRD